jgi:hypothetical protein
LAYIYGQTKNTSIPTALPTPIPTPAAIILPITTPILTLSPTSAIIYPTGVSINKILPNPEKPAETNK